MYVILDFTFIFTKEHVLFQSLFKYEHPSPYGRLSVKLNLSERRVNTVDAKILFLAIPGGKSNKSRGELVDTNFPRFTALGFPITRRSILLLETPLSPWQKVCSTLSSPSMATPTLSWSSCSPSLPRTKKEMKSDQSKPQEIGIRITSFDQMAKRDGTNACDK